MLAGLVVKLAPETEQVNKTLTCWKHQRQCCFFYRFVSKIMSQWKKRNKAEALCGKQRDSDALHWNSISIWCVLLWVFLVVSGSTISPQQILHFSLLLTLSENMEFKKICLPSLLSHLCHLHLNQISTLSSHFKCMNKVKVESAVFASSMRQTHETDEARLQLQVGRDRKHRISADEAA